MFRTTFVGLIAAAAVSAQAPPGAPVTVEVVTEAARCEAIAAKSVCFRYAASPVVEIAGIFEPGSTVLRLDGVAGLPVSVQGNAISPVGRSWLGVRGVGETEYRPFVSGTLPLNLEVAADAAQLAEIKAGRFVGIVSVTVAGSPSPLKLPVQLEVTAETDAIKAAPDFISDLTVTASASNLPLRYPISVERAQTEPPVYVSVTPETSDGGNWLSANLAFGAGQCADQPAPCAFEAEVRPPARAGTYWGVLVITGDGFADRVPVRVTVNPAPQAVPISIVPRQVTMSAPLGSNYAVAATVSLSGGNRDGVSYRAVYTDPWLAVEPPTGTWPVTLRLVMSPAKLDAGVYSDLVTIRSNDTNEVLATIPVRFNIIAPAFAPAMLDGGGWRTRLYLVNPSPVEARATLKFWYSGAPWLLGVENKGLVTKVENEVIPPGGLRVIETQGAQSRTQQGWAELTSDGPVAMHAVLAEAKQVSKWLPVDATVPLMNPYQDHMLIPFDNLDGAAASVSLANAGDEPLVVEVTILNENGAEIAKEGKLTLAPREGGTYALAEKWTSTVGRRGLVSLRFGGGRLFAIGLRSQGKGFYAYPAVACAEMGLDRAVPNVTVGGPWQSTAYLANTTSMGQYGLLRLWPGKGAGASAAVPGLNDESAPVVPPNGILAWQAPCKDTSRAAGGWLESRYSKQVGGFMLLRQNYPGAPAAGSAVERYESALGAQRGLTGRVAIPFDNRESNSTRIVLVNPGDTPTDVQTVIYDLAGRYPRYTDSFRLPAKGQLVVNAADRWELGTPQGILEFSSRQGVALTGVGLRFSDGAMTILPAYEK